MMILLLLLLLLLPPIIIIIIIPKKRRPYFFKSNEISIWQIRFDNMYINIIDESFIYIYIYI
jgi:hypothetical protein